MYHKRLERGTFEVIKTDNGKTKQPMRYDHLVMLLSGISVCDAVQRKDAWDIELMLPGLNI